MSAEIEAELPALPDEQQKNVIQTKKVAELTVEPGVMRLPVSQVTTAENSDKWAIDLEHPILGELRVFREKPVHGWHEDQEFVKLLHWYDIWDENPYRLQREYVYLAHQPAKSDYNHGWRLIDPHYDDPERLTRREKATRKIRDSKNSVKHLLPARHPLVAWLMIGFFSILSVTLMAIPSSVAAAPSFGLVTSAYVIASFITALLMTPPENG